MPDKTSDRHLVERLRGGDVTAMPELQTIYGSRIYQLAFRYMKNREDAEEITQDVLLRVFRKIDGFRGDAALSSWIYRITFNTAMSRLRTLKHRRPAEVPHETVSQTDLADDRLMRTEMRTRLVSALSALPDIYRAAVLLRDVQGLSTEEASGLLGVKPQTLKSRLHRGRLILREQLANFADGLAMRSVA